MYVILLVGNRESKVAYSEEMYGVRRLTPQDLDLRPRLSDISRYQKNVLTEGYDQKRSSKRPLTSSKGFMIERCFCRKDVTSNIEKYKMKGLPCSNKTKSKEL